MEEINNEYNNYYELLLSDMQDIFSPLKMNSTLSLEEAKSKEIHQIKPQIKFVLTKQQSSSSVNFLKKKTLPKPEESNLESENPNNGRWNKEEQKLFAEAVLKFGNDWKKIQNYVSSRNLTQIRSHAQKFLLKLKENPFIKEKGLQRNLSWTKIMIILKATLTYDELKNVLFSVEPLDKKNIKKFKKIVYKNYSGEKKDKGINQQILSNEEEEQNYKINNDKIMQEKDEIELQKFIECFNNSYGEITLNSSFEENSDNYEENNLRNKLINEMKVKYYETY